jgi:hypothetical protein
VPLSFGEKPATVTPPAPKAGAMFTIAAAIVGGNAPFDYTITFDNDDIIKSIGPKTINVRNISEQIQVPALAKNETVVFSIKVKDKDGKTFEYNTNKSHKILLTP